MRLELSKDVRDVSRTMRRNLRFYTPLVLLLALPAATLVLAMTAMHGLLSAPSLYRRPHELVLVSNRFGHDGQQRGAASGPPRSWTMEVRPSSFR